MRHVFFLAAFTLAVTASAQEAEVPARTDAAPAAQSQVTQNPETGVSRRRIHVLARINELDTWVQVVLESEGVSAECLLTATSPCSLDFVPGAARVSGGHVVKGKVNLPPGGGVLSYRRTGHGKAWVGGGFLLLSGVLFVPASAPHSDGFGGGLINAAWALLGTVSFFIGAPLLAWDLLEAHEWFEFEPAGGAALPRARPLFASARLTLAPTGMSFVATF